MTHFIAVLRLSVALATCLAVAGCTSFQPLRTAKPESIVANIEPGDDVRVHVKDGRVFEFEVTSLTETQLLGAESGRTFRIDFSQIESVEVRKASFLHTLGLGIGVWYVVSALAVYAAFETLD